MNLGVLDTAVEPRRLPRWRIAQGWPLMLAGLVGLDALALTLTFVLAYLLRFQFAQTIFKVGDENPSFYTQIVVWALPAWLVLFFLYRLYDRRFILAGAQEYGRVFSSCTAGALGIIVISFFYEMPSVARGWLVLVWVLSIVLVCGERFVVRRVVRRLYARGHLTTPAIIVGTNEEGRALADQLLHDSRSGMQLCGFVTTTEGGEDADSLNGLSVLGNLDDLPGLLSAWRAADLVIVTTALTRDQLLDLYRRFGHDPRIELRLSSGLYEFRTTGVRVQEFSAVPLMTLERVRITGADAVLKALLDYTVAWLGLIALLPCLVLIALLVRLDSPGPIFYRRRVLGRGGSQFNAFKFRTMIEDRRSRQAPITFPDRRSSDKHERDPRITRIGRLLRRTSLDELPQLLNVIRGEMSLVGPRMISPGEASLYGKWQFNLLTVKPGITGPWQTQGRGTLSYEERVRLSMDYIRNYSIWRDLEIMLRTVPSVISGHGAF
jgi:exopolysaccharide biosynthesis polyprenyl glycosylphosphotransferase